MKLNSRLNHYKRVMAVLGLVVWVAVPALAQALVFVWQENPLPVADMRLSGVAASPEQMIAIGSRGTTPDLEWLAATSTDGLDWQIVDIGLAGRRATDIIYADGRFIVTMDGGSLRIGDADGGNWTEVTPPAEFRLRFPALVEHDGKILLFGRLASDEQISRIIATADFQTWTPLYEANGFHLGPGLVNPVSSGSALAMRVFLEPPSVPVNNLLFSLDGSDWEGLGFDTFFIASSVTARGPILYAVGREGSQNPQPLQTLRRGPPDADWQRIFDPDIPIESVGPFGGGAPGLVLRAQIDGQRALLTSSDASSWTRQAFVPSGLLSDFVAWRGGWVGVGEIAVLGQPPGSVPVPALSPLGGAALVLGVLALILARARARLPRRAG